VVGGRSMIGTDTKWITGVLTRAFFFKENKELLMEQIPKVIMPKKGKCNKAEREEETTLSFTKQRRKHSAVESNINELEQKQGIKSLSR
jgi:hypothetical protein